jgi:predicted Zn-dependent protease
MRFAAQSAVFPVAAAANSCHSPHINTPLPPIVEEHRRTLVAAQGYCELQMYDDALAELDALPDTARHEPTVVEMRLMVLMQAKRFSAALEIARELCTLRPDSPVGFIHAAFCLHETGCTEEARMLLLSGPPALEKEATFHYNLGCYECALGRFESAREHLKKSFEMDRKFREFAKTDRDLEPLRSEL